MAGSGTELNSTVEASTCRDASHFLDNYEVPRFQALTEQSDIRQIDYEDDDEGELSERGRFVL
jgi:hypothetical protein